MMPTHRGRTIDHRRAFTLVEVLVAVAIVALLVALLIPSVQAAREAMRRAGCSNNLKQMGIALHGYQSVHETFPPGYCSLGLTSNPESVEVGPGWGWGSSLLDHLDNASLYNSINFGTSLLDPASLTASRTVLGVYVCPSSVGDGPARPGPLGSRPDVEVAASRYVASTGLLDPEEHPHDNNGLFVRNACHGVRDIPDGSAHTLAIGERSRNLADAVWIGAIPGYLACHSPSWPGPRSCEPAAALVLGAATPPGRLDPSMPPNSAAAGPGHFWSLHPGGANFLLADGSTRFVRATIDARAFASLITRDGSEAVGEF